jgi:predicted O-methyltransferase YrrM
MTSTRVATLVAFVVGTVGFALVAIVTATPLALAGGAMVMASAIYLVRHLWRESDRKRKSDVAAQRQDLSLVMTELNTTIENSWSNVEKPLRTAAGEISDRLAAYNRAILEYVAQIQLDLASTKKDLVGLRKELDRQQSHHEAAERRAERRASKERAYIASEVSGVIGVYSALQPQLPYPPFGGWSISGDLASRLVELILTDHRRSIIEVGSGLSTLLIAQALELHGDAGHCIALEHDKGWLDKSNALLAQHGVSHRALVVHAPLVETDIRGEKFQWYDLSNAELPDQIDLLFIDGPPEGTGPLARYPALPVLIERLMPTGVVLMDDAYRPDERSAVERWRTEYPDLVIVRHSDSKGTFEIRRAPT